MYRSCSRSRGNSWAVHQYVVSLLDGMETCEMIESDRKYLARGMKSTCISIMSNIVVKQCERTGIVLDPFFF